MTGEDDVHRRAMVALLAGLAMLGPSPAASAAPVYTFDVTIETACVGGHGPDGAPLSVTVRTADGERLGAKSATANASGHWQACFDGFIVEPGMTITAKHAAAKRSVSVPKLTLRTDRASDVLSGRGPAGAHVPLTLTRCAFRTSCLVKHYVVVPDGSGHYRDDVSAASFPWDLQGGDEAQVDLQTTAGDVFHAHAVTAFMRLELPNRATVPVYPGGQTVNVSLRSANGTLLATRTRTVTQPGTYDFRFVKDGQAVTIHPGNVIVGSFASDARIVWPHVQLSGDTATDHVSGTCLKDMAVQVTVSGSTSHTQVGMAGSDGTFDLDFHSHGGVHSGNMLVLICRADTGDELEFRGHVPE